MFCKYNSWAWATSVPVTLHDVAVMQPSGHMAHTSKGLIMNQQTIMHSAACTLYRGT